MIHQFISESNLVFKSIIASIILVTTTTLGLGAQEASPLKAILGNEAFDKFAISIRPLLVKYCAECHSPKSMEGLEFLEAKSESDLAKLRGVYAAVVEQMENRMMPPEGDLQPSQVERTKITAWIRKTLDLKASDTDRIAQYVVAAYEDKKGNLWFGTTAKGAVRFDGKTLKWFSTKDGLPSTVVTSFAEDKDGNLWMGTHEGICRFDGKSITRFGKADGLSAVDPAKDAPFPPGGGGVRVDRDGNLWANMNHGVYRFDSKKFAEFKLPFVKSTTTPYAIFNGRPAMKLHDRDGNLWFTTDGYGVFKFDGKTFTHFTKEDGLCSNTVNNIVQDQKGNIWFACMQAFQPNMTGDGGLCRLDGNKFTSFPNVKGLNENDIYTIYETKAGELWIGATHVGAYRIDGEKFTLFDETDRPHWTRYFGLQAMLEDRKGTLWCGFSGGLFRFNSKSFSNVTEEALLNATKSQEQTEKEVEPLLEAPDDWGVEQIRFPLSFAPSIKFSGYEDIRFSPGWSKVDSPEFWTYKMVWHLDEDPQLTEERLAELFETYYDGLACTVAQAGATNPIALQKPVAVFIRDGDNFRGKLRIYDPFTTKDWICLHAQVQKSKRGDKNLVVIEMSPKPFDNEVWNELKKVRVIRP